MATRSRVFLDVSHGTEPLGRIVIELFNDKAPKTCENFRALCTGTSNRSYKSAHFHRIIDEFMIQGGDITKGDGTGGDSIYDGEFEDENLGWREIDASGLVCMANHGKDTNSSQFFITLVPCPHLNNKHTVFGHVVSGKETIERMSKVDVDSDDKPHTAVLVTHCGELERRKKPQSVRGTNSHSTSEERGRGTRRPSDSRSPSQDRRRRSDRNTRRSSSDSITPPPARKKHRTRSDATIDHNLRGRPRERSTDRSRSPLPLRTDGSPVHKHRRARSPPPSRPRSKSRSRSPDVRRQTGLSDQHGRRDHRGYHDRREWGGGQRDYRRRDEDELRKVERRREGNRGRYRESNDGRLGGGAFDEYGDEGGDGIVYKGRGSMKYREQQHRDQQRRRW